MDIDKIKEKIELYMNHGMSGVNLEEVYQIYDNVNHSYDGFPYKIHLKMVICNVLKYAHLIIPTINIDEDNEDEFDKAKRMYNNLSIDEYYIPRYVKILIYSAALHDAIEDCRMTYNDVKNKVLFLTCSDYMIAEKVADIVYAVTNEKGKNRAERANEKYYEGIKNTQFATYIKYCDRLANIQYGSMFKYYLGGNRMVDVYRKEHSHFISMLDCDESKLLSQIEEEMKILLN